MSIDTVATRKQNRQARQTYLAIFVALTLAYIAAFASSARFEIGDAIFAALLNSVPAVVLGFVFHLLLENQLWFRAPRVVWIVLPPLVAGFAFAWYVVVLIAIGLRTSSLDQGFPVVPFSGPGFVWQTYQGVTLFALMAAVSHILWLRARLVDAQARRAPPRAECHRSILVQRDGETVRLDTNAIVRLSGAGDYVEIVTRNESWLSNGTLAKFEARLDPAKFFRAHRSHIVAVAAIERSEPAGNGRTTLHLVNAENLVTSRNGTRILREFSL
jgi:two-component system, LytTR family, response regulator